MDKKEFGQKIRLLREGRGISREELCGDETELSVRQLARIEMGASKPTLTKITFIASQFGMTLYQLMPDYVALPEEYLSLKYDVLRTPTYEEDGKKDWRDSILTEIYDQFYDELPEEEQLSVDTIQSIVDVHDTEDAIYGRDILQEYYSQISHKEQYSVNELLMSRLFLEHVRFTDLEKYPKEQLTFQHLLETLPNQIEFTNPKDLFILRDVLFVMVSVVGSKGLSDYLPIFIETIEQIMNRTQDYQKLPILKMINWKYELFNKKNSEKAKHLYEQAIMVAQMIGDMHLLSMLKEEWGRDQKETL